MSKELDRLNRAVDDFSLAMKWKLLYKLNQGFSGWDDPRYKEVIQKRLRIAVAKLLTGDVQQAVDVANLAMMLHYQSGAELT